jgi:hypothetical protein
MNRRVTFVLIVMMLAVLAACLPAAPDEAVSVAVTLDGSSGAAATGARWR